MKNEQAFKRFQTLTEDNISEIEKLFPKAVPTFLLQTLFNCQRIGVKDKFFYDALLEQLEAKISTLDKSQDLLLLGVAMSMNPDFKIDHQSFILRFYENVYKNRFLLKLNDKQSLSRIFTDMGLQKINKKHLDLFQEVKSKESQKLALEKFNIEVPENMLLDFDFEHRVAVMKNKKTQQVIVVFGSDHHCEQSINFGKQLMDTFKPQTIVIEDQPLEFQVKGEERDDRGWIYPQKTEVVTTLKGNEMKQFIQSSIENNKDAYEVDEKHQIVYKAQGLPIKMPSDFPTFANYHLFKNAKNVEKSALVLGDLTSAERSVSFIESVTDKELEHLNNELKYLVLMDTTAWLGESRNLGCVKCASFLNKKHLHQYPARPMQLLSEDQVPSFRAREKHVAYNILKTALENPSQQNFVAFVGSGHLMNVTKDIINFLNKGEDYMNYKRPSATIENDKVMSDQGYRNSLIRKHAFQVALYEQDQVDEGDLPFIHKEEDKVLQKAYEQIFLKKVTFVDEFQDIEGLGIQFSKEDFMKEPKNKPVESDPFVDEYLASKGGKLQCQTLNFLQGNFAYYYMKRNELLNQAQTTNNVSKISEIVDSDEQQS